MVIIFNKSQLLLQIILEVNNIIIKNNFNLLRLVRKLSFTYYKNRKVSLGRLMASIFG